MILGPLRGSKLLEVCWPGVNRVSCGKQSLEVGEAIVELEDNVTTRSQDRESLVPL